MKAWDPAHEGMMNQNKLIWPLSAEHVDMRDNFVYLEHVNVLVVENPFGPPTTPHEGLDMVCRQDNRCRITCVRRTYDVKRAQTRARAPAV